MSDLLDKAKKLRAEAEIKTAEAQQLEAMAAYYPEARRYVGRWEKEVFCTAKVNPLVTACDIRHNCGCCSDSPLEVWPYVLTADGGRVYSDPPCFTVGEKENGGDRPWNRWQERLRFVGIASQVVDLVEGYFEENPPYDEEET